jgi:hypothetical protein
MVAIVLTRAGFEDMRPRVDAGRDAIWVGADVLNPAEIADLRGLGFNLTVFDHRLDPEELDGDIWTVIEHHPGQILWVESLAGQPATGADRGEDMVG